MPGLGGLELQKALAAKKDLMPVVFLTANGDVPSSVRAMKQGAVDFSPNPSSGMSCFKPSTAPLPAMLPPAKPGGCGESGSIATKA